jgi:hypothetical protein
MSDANKPSNGADRQTTNLKRRSFVTASLRLSLAATLIHTAAARAGQCMDPEELSSADYQFRKYVEYTESSSDPEKTCGKCRFFKQGSGECGSCQVVAASINANGHCKSWEAQPAK